MVENLPIQPNPHRTINAPSKVFTSADGLLRYLDLRFVGDYEWKIKSMYRGNLGIVVLQKLGVVCNADGTSCSIQDMKEYDEHKKLVYNGEFYVSVSCKISRNMSPVEIQQYFKL